MKRQYWYTIIGALGLLTIGGVTMGVPDSLINSIAIAVATAEGFYVAGSIPAQNNNPGDLKLDITGKGIGTDSHGFVMYATAQDGWEALKKQISLMFNGSGIYSPTMTIQEIATHYAPGSQAFTWATNVANALGVTPDTTLNQLLS